jgi:hypothetical protein
MQKRIFHRENRTEKHQLSGDFSIQWEIHDENEKPRLIDLQKVWCLRRTGIALV